MESAEPTSAERVVTYCLVPRELAAKLHEPLRRHFADDPDVEVVVERRARERRADAERRARIGRTRQERRRIRNAEGRRVGERRATQVRVESDRPLPRRARGHADALAWVELIEPSEEHRLDLDTARLVTRVQAGDRDAFGAIYLRYFDRVYGYLRVIFREDPHEAEDLTQQVFTKVLEALPRYERTSRPFRAWLFTIVKNQALSQLERRGRSDPFDPDALTRLREAPADEDGGLEVLAWLTDRELVMFVERLPLAQRQVLVLRYMLDLSTTEIARVLDRQTPDVRMLESRALRFLEVRLRALGRAPRATRRTEVRRRPSRIWVSRQRRFALVR